MNTYSIVTTAMQQHITAPSELYNQTGLTEENAKALFSQACEQYNLDNADGQEAGGRGYDYRVELIAE